MLPRMIRTSNEWTRLNKFEALLKSDYFIFFKLFRRNERTHGKLTMRVFKNEFEFQAKKDIPSGKIVDGGVLSAFYMWVLFEE